MKVIVVLAWMVFGCIAAGSRAEAAGPTYPPTSKRPVSDTYQGVVVSDDYRWLEDGSAADVKAWIAAQNQFARAYLDAIPQRPEIARRVSELLRARAVRRFAFELRGQLFALKNAPPNNQAQLVVMPRNGDVAKERVVVDPLRIDPKGGTTIDFYRPSYDGKHVVVSLSENGSEDGTAYVYEVATGKRLPDRVPGVNFPTAGGSFEWAPDGSGFYYTRYPREGERPAADRHFYQTVWFHALGTPLRCRPLRGRARLSADCGDSPAGEVATANTCSPRSATATAARSRFICATAPGSGRRSPISATASSAWNSATTAGCTRRRSRTHRSAVSSPSRSRSPSLAKATIVVPESELGVEAATPTRTRLYVRYRDGGPSVLRIYTLDGKRLPDLPAEPLSEISIGARLSGDDVLVHTMSYRSPQTWFRYDAARNRLVPTSLNGKSDVAFDDAVVVREFAVSKDGTKIPVNIVHRKGLELDGRNPVLLLGYGGYGISMTPWFDPLLRLWLDYGGVFAVANLRGGGEYGEPWHAAGMLTRKQNVFDDFAAAMRLLVERKYTSPERLAITGRSNGGLTMGAALTQHPQAMRAVVSGVGMYDALRWETQPNGEFNTTEFGSVKDPAQFKALYEYSPLLRVRDGVAYPAVLLTTGANDGRVAPHESRKMAARLQAATSSANPILLRTEAAAGHGIGTSLAVRIEEKTDEYAFLVDQLGMEAPMRKGVDPRAP